MKRNVEVLEAAKRLDVYKIKMLKGNPHLAADVYKRQGIPWD